VRVPNIPALVVPEVRVCAVLKPTWALAFSLGQATKAKARAAMFATCPAERMVHLSYWASCRCFQQDRGSLGS
jgi:hypothetical protein